MLLTSRARDTLRTVTHCIVDEIHALCPNKRGVFLALLLERLAALNPAAASSASACRRRNGRWRRWPAISAAGARRRRHPDAAAGHHRRCRPAQATSICRSSARSSSSDRCRRRAIWPSIYRLLGDQIRQHRSTIIFANNRRGVERITRLPQRVDGERQLARAHHGSVALEVRQQTEQALKEGRLPAVVATASLELGIDMGAVDLVCQVESPGSVARGLQRVGRAGHLVGQRARAG